MQATSEAARRARRLALCRARLGPGRGEGVLDEDDADIRRPQDRGAHGGLPAVRELREERERTAVAASDEPGGHRVEDRKRGADGEAEGLGAGERGGGGRRRAAERVCGGEDDVLGDGPGGAVDGVELPGGERRGERGAGAVERGERGGGAPAREGSPEGGAAEDRPAGGEVDRPGDRLCASERGRREKVRRAAARNWERSRRAAGNGRTIGSRSPASASRARFSGAPSPSTAASCGTSGAEPPPPRASACAPPLSPPPRAPMLPPAHRPAASASSFRSAAAVCCAAGSSRAALRRSALARGTSHSLRASDPALWRRAALGPAAGPTAAGTPPAAAPSPPSPSTGCRSARPPAGSPSAARLAEAVRSMLSLSGRRASPRRSTCRGRRGPRLEG